LIRTYLGYIEIIEMISRRLTKTQKAEILEAYRAGDNTNLIANNYNCTPNTINRTVKTLLSEREYTLLKKNRAKNSSKNENMLNNKIVKEQKEDLEKANSLISFKEKVEEEDLNIKNNEGTHVSDFDEASSEFSDTEDSHSEDLISENHDNDDNNQNIDNNFEEIAPLLSGFDFNLEKQKSDYEILNYESLPESVYMIVDKKVELDLQPISELPEWSFLPENELQRNAILLFSNQRSAKRICSRNQRVIKVPNTSIFKLSKSYLISKGITRLILEDSIIGLED
jgi:hypothetical protein